MRIQAWLTVILIVSVSVSCDSGDIIHIYRPDVTPLIAIDTSKDLIASQLPEPTRKLAIDGVNTSSKSKQPSGIRDWVEYLLPPTIPGRHVAVSLRIFNDDGSAEWYMDFLSKTRLFAQNQNTKVEKFTKGTLPNGLEYRASYIKQHRADPEGCNRPMESYSSFLLVRSRNHLIQVDVDEKRPSGVTSTDIDYIVRLLAPRT